MAQHAGDCAGMEIDIQVRAAFYNVGGSFLTRGVVASPPIQTITKDEEVSADPGIFPRYEPGGDLVKAVMGSAGGGSVALKLVYNLKN
eukprot:82574-Amphidinium_carterae.1